MEALKLSATKWLRSLVVRVKAVLIFKTSFREFKKIILNLGYNFCNSLMVNMHCSQFVSDCAL